jgi:hypothetical protein
MLARSEASTIETGSSARRTRGRSRKARATMIRCRWPPLSSCGKRPSTSCPTSTTAAPSAAWRRPSTCMTWRWTITSRALVGSSATITRGRPDMAMASVTRCFIPPLSSCGKRRAVSAGSPTLASRSRTCPRSASRGPATPWPRSPSRICSSIRMVGVQGVHRPLRHQGDADEAEPADLLRAHRHEVLPLEPDLAPHDAPGRPRQAEQGHPERRLARPGLAHDRQALARRQAEAHPVHRLHRAPVGVEVDPEVAHLQDARRRARGAGRHTRCRSRGFAHSSSPTVTSSRKSEFPF